MFRALAAVAMTVVGLFLVLTYKTSPIERPAATPSTGSGNDFAPTGPVASAPPPSTQPATRTIDGPVVSMRWGDVQVAVTLNGSTITDVTTLMVPTERARSASINGQAVPMLKAEVLQAQSASIDVISGATYTTEAYAQSLQAALDAARA